MTTEWQNRLEANGVDVLAARSNNWFVANVSGAGDDWVTELAFVDGVEPVPTDHVLDDRLEEASGEVPVDVVPWLASASGFQDACQAVVALGGSVVQPLSTPSTHLVDAWIEATNLTALADNPAVAWIQPALNGTNETMQNLRSVTGAERLHDQADTSDFTGEGVRGMVVAADGVDEHHEELNGSVIEYHERYRDLGEDCNVESTDEQDLVFDDSEDHGTKVFGTLHADGSVDEDGSISKKKERNLTGMAPNASSVVAERQRLQRLPQALAERRAHGITFASYSWIYNVVNPFVSAPAYTVPAMESDLVVSEADVSVYQSMGNQGPGHAAPVATAKNVVSVGGLYHNDDRNLTNDVWEDPDRLFDNTEGQASTGPTADGRIKPDLVGPFNMVFTTSVDGVVKNETTTQFDGTSAAAPIVAGAGALVEQMVREGVFLNASQEPTEGTPQPALVKELLVNSAHTFALPVDPATIDGDRVNPANTRHFQGWGQPNVTELETDGRDVFTVNGTIDLVTGARYNVEYDLPDGTDWLRVSLAWTDPPTPPNQGLRETSANVSALVNDLDLEVRSPDGTTYIGNGGLMEDNESDPVGEQVGYPVTGADRLNNVENVFVNVSDTNVWTTTVQAAGVNRDARPSTPAVDQPFGLVVRPIGEPPDDTSSGGGGGGGIDTGLMMPK